jgi:hypothetical protein
VANMASIIADIGNRGAPTTGADRRGPSRICIGISAPRSRALQKPAPKGRLGFWKPRRCGGDAGERWTGWWVRYRNGFGGLSLAATWILETPSKRAFCFSNSANLRYFKNASSNAALVRILV